jgi:hypothetical protein
LCVDGRALLPVGGRNVSTTARFAVGDVIQTYVIQNSGSSVGTIADPRTSLNVQFVAP